MKRDDLLRSKRFEEFGSTLLCRRCWGNYHSMLLADLNWDCFVFLIYES